MNSTSSVRFAIVMDCRTQAQIKGGVQAYNPYFLHICMFSVFISGYRCEGRIHIYILKGAMISF